MGKNDSLDTRDSRKIAFKTDRNAIILAIILLVQTWGIALIERAYRSDKNDDCDTIGLLKQADKR